MAQQTKRKSERKRPKQSQSESSASRSRKTAKQRRNGSGRNKSPIRNQGSDQTVPERMYEDYTLLDPGEISDTDEPDVVVDIPVVKVDEIHFELDDLEARVALHAEVLDLVKLSVGVHVELGKVELDIKGVEAQALLRARLDHVTAIIDRVLTTLDRNPEVLKSIAHTLEPVGEGAGKAVGEVGEGAGGAVEDVGGGAGKAVDDVGEGAGQAVGGLGEGAGQALGQVGGLAQLGGGSSGGNGGNGGNGGQGASGGQIAKQIAKIVAKELGAAASDEAKDLGLAATHKARELGERRRRRRAMKHNATEAALRKAEEAGVDVDEIEGTGAEGRVTVHDVEKAAAG
jgi:hypothetical protein